MRKRRQRRSFFVKSLGLVLGLFFVWTVDKALSSSISPTWREEMRRLQGALTDLLPYATTTAAFNDPKNATAIDSAIQRLLASSKILTHNRDKVEGLSDPTLVFVAEYFENNLRAIHESNRLGRRDFSRFMVLNTTNFCIECHTRTQTGPEAVVKAPTLSSLNPVEEVEYLISLRRFSDAMTSVEMTLKKKPDLPLFGGENLLRYGLTLAVKYFSAPQKALRMLEAAEKSKTIPSIVKKDLAVWKTQLRAWEKEKPAVGAVAAEQVMTQAEDLLKRAEDLNRKNSSLHAGDVEVLRANAMVQNLFSTKLTEDQMARALSLMGQSYQLLPEHLFWVLHEAFYEACIRVLPHSLRAESCFTSLQDSLELGFSGGQALALPPEVKRRLNELRALSKRKLLRPPKGGLN